jgi:hypothetical protein
MKHNGSFVSQLTGYAVALLATALVTTSYAAMEEGQATVRGIRGTANYSTGGGGWSAVRVGTILKAGDTVKTDPNSSVDLDMKENGEMVRVTPDTTLRIDKLTKDKTGADTVIETQLDLKNGRILGRVNKMAAASKYEVKIPTGVVGIRGTRYDISASGIVRISAGQAVVVTVDSGTGQASTFVVNGGQTFLPPGTVMETPPEVAHEMEAEFQLLPAPDTSRPTDSPKLSPFDPHVSPVNPFKPLK